MKAAAIRAVVTVGALYLVAGLVFGTLAGRAASAEMRATWRWAAWIVSAAAFGAHIIYDQVRLRGSLKGTALRVASAAALGSFGLAVAANVHALSLAASQRSPLILPSLALWPLLTGIPAFAVALVAAALLDRARRQFSP